MKIQELGTVEMFRSNPQHFGNGKIRPLTYTLAGQGPVAKVEGVSQETQAASIQRAGAAEGKKSFTDYLLEAVNSVSSQQNEVSNITEKLITNPDEVDVHDATIAMAKARMSMNLAQNVIDRMVTAWNEITTTR
ncbi:MAG: flagellar hook-basal body complex protein FliE [Treponema sp.]|nr:flagellar hook-basal body complex protein FliE [Treponema sp.]